MKIKSAHMKTFDLSVSNKQKGGRAGLGLCKRTFLPSLYRLQSAVMVPGLKSSNGLSITCSQAVICTGR